MTTYFEISPIINYIIRNNGSLTGIQRVELNIIKEYSKNDANAKILYCRSKLSNLHIFDCKELIEKGFFSDPQKLVSLVFQSDELPSQLALKYLLGKKETSKWLRGFRKIGILLTAILQPEKYRNLIADELRNHVSVEFIKNLAPGDTVFVIGNALSIDPIIKHLKAFKRSGGRTIQTIHDAIPLTHPDFFPKKSREKFRDWFHQLPSYATHLHCVSKNTELEVKKAIDSRLFLDVFSIGLAHEFIGHPRVTDETPSPGTTARPFALCVGTLEIRKNGANLLRAWRAAYQEIGSALPKLVFAGKKGWILDDFDQLYQSDSFYKEYVEIEASPSDERLIGLYRECQFTIFPSFYEGWGLPVGESLWFGKNCITSNTSSLPQVGGNLVDYIDPDDVGQIRDAIVKNVMDADHAAMKRRLIRNAPLRDWACVARELHEYQKKAGA